MPLPSRIATAKDMASALGDFTGQPSSLNGDVLEQTGCAPPPLTDELRDVGRSVGSRRAKVK